jgi:hypothetical protein
LSISSALAALRWRVPSLLARGRSRVGGQRLPQHARGVDPPRLVVALELEGHITADLDSGLLAQPLVEADQVHAGVDGDRSPELDAVYLRRTGARALP